jgi:hypothetical protein
METLSQQEVTPTHWALFMFMSLSQQAEGWAWNLKGKVNLRTKQLLSTYLNSAKALSSHMSGQFNMDILLDNSAVWSDLMKLMTELPLHKQQALYIAFKELLDGNIKVEDDDQDTTLDETI